MTLPPWTSRAIAVAMVVVADLGDLWGQASQAGGLTPSDIAEAVVIVLGALMLALPPGPAPPTKEDA